MSIVYRLYCRCILVFIKKIYSKPLKKRTGFSWTYIFCSHWIGMWVLVLCIYTFKVHVVCVCEPISRISSIWIQISIVQQKSWSRSLIFYLHRWQRMYTCIPDTTHCVSTININTKSLTFHWLMSTYIQIYTTIIQTISIQNNIYTAIDVQNKMYIQ